MKSKKSTSTTKPATVSPNRYFILGGSILVLAAALYFFLDPQYRTGVYNDDAFYVLTARDLISPQHLPTLLERRLDFPLPGLPLVLAPLAAAVQPHWTDLEKLSIVFTLLSAFLIMGITRKWVTKGESLAVAALFAFNPLVAKFSGIVMPAPYYTAAVLATFWLMSAWIDSPTAVKSIGLGVLLGWASLLRAEGVLLLACVGAGLVASRRDGRQLGLVALPFVFWCFFLRAWETGRSAAPLEYAGDLSALASYWQHSFFSGIYFVWELLWMFGVHAVAAFPLTPSLAHQALAVSLTFILILLIAGGFRNLWKTKPERRHELATAGAFCGLYLAVHLFWKVAQPRYALTLLPFVLIFSTRGLRAAIARFGVSPGWARLPAAFLLAYYAFVNIGSLRETMWSPDLMKAPPWRSLAWLRDHAPPEAKTLSPIASTIELYAQYPSKPEINAKTSEGYLYALVSDGLGYVVDRKTHLLSSGVAHADNPEKRWALYRYWMKLHPEHFRLLYQDSDEQTTILQIVSDRHFPLAYERFLEAARSYQSGHYEQAFRQVRACIADYPTLGAAVNLEGALYFLKNDRVHAEKDFLRSIELLPGSPVAMINLATLYEVSGRQVLAEKFIARAREASAARGEEESFLQNLNGLRNLWDRGRGIAFIHPV